MPAFIPCLFRIFEHLSTPIAISEARELSCLVARVLSRVDQRDHVQFFVQIIHIFLYFVARSPALGWDCIADDRFEEMNWASLPINPENSSRTLLNSLVMLSDTFIDCERRTAMLDSFLANSTPWTLLEDNA
jgi:hypothetical protein